MTLATFVLVSIACCTPASGQELGLPLQSVQVSGIGSSSSQDQAKQDPTPSPQSAPQSASPQQSSSSSSSTSSPAAKPAGKPATTPHKGTGKKAASSNCPAASADKNSTPAPATANSNATKSGTAQTNCPPSKSQAPAKIVVQQGGSSEPSIQLAPGAGGDQGAGERERANQMLDATEQNLKKLEGQQLSQNQQDMLKQVRQFEDQAKKAVAAGDFDRGRTLAWKAQVMSEELVNPGK